MKDTLGPFVMLEFVGGPKDGETEVCISPVESEYRVPLPEPPRIAMSSPSLEEMLSWEPRTGVYCLTSRPHEYQKLVLPREVVNQSKISLELMVRLEMKGKPTLQLDWMGER